MAREHIADDDLALLDTLPELLDPIIERAQQEAGDPNGLARFQADAFAQIFPDPNIRKMVPQETRDQINFEAGNLYRERIETGALFDLGSHVHGSDYQLLLDRVEAAARLPPSARSVWMDRQRLSSMPSTDTLLIELLDEQRRQRAERELKSSLPSVVLWNYSFAEDPVGSTRRLIEEMHANGWRGITTDDPVELAAAMELRRAIEADKAARVPQSVNAAKAVLARAASALQRLQTVSGLVPRRPGRAVGV